MFTKALNILKGLLTGASTLAPLLTILGIAIPPAAIAAIPATIGLMTAAEEALGDGTGPLKKEAVVAGVQSFASVMQTVSTGGQRDTWNKVTPEVVDTMVDAMATTANGIAKEFGSGPVFSEMDLRNSGQ